MAIRDKMAANAAPLLQPGERVQAVFGGQTMSQYWVLLTFLILLAKNEYRVIVVTDRRILVFNGGRFSQTEIKGVHAELPRATQIGPPKGMWWTCESLGDRLHIHRRFHKDVQAADSARTP